MIARIWRGVASTPSNADAYERHVIKTVFPTLAAIPGHRGARVLRRSIPGGVEILILTLWDSMAAIRRFSGANAESAVVEPEARAVLSEYDDFVRHYEVTYDTNDAASGK